MSQKLEVRQPPLLTNRHRLLTVSDQQSAKPSWPRLIVQNGLVALIIIALFLVGSWIANPNIVGAIGSTIGDGWTSLMQNLFGSSIGTGLADKSPWIVARVGGILAYLLLFASVGLGLANKLRLLDRYLTRAQVMYLHRFIAMMAFVFTGLHVGGLLLDTYLTFDLGSLLIPFTSEYRPLWTGLGTLVVYGAAAVAITAYLSRRVGYKVWRTIHYLSFGIFAATLMHGLMAGTDSSSLWMKLIYIATGGCVAVLTGVRFLKPKKAKTTNVRAAAKAE